MLLCHVCVRSLHAAARGASAAAAAAAGKLKKEDAAARCASRAASGKKQGRKRKNPGAAAASAVSASAPEEEHGSGEEADEQPAANRQKGAASKKASPRKPATASAVAARGAQAVRAGDEAAACAAGEADDAGNAGKAGDAGDADIAAADDAADCDAAAGNTAPDVAAAGDAVAANADAGDEDDGDDEDDEDEEDDDADANAVGVGNTGDSGDTAAGDAAAGDAAADDAAAVDAGAGDAATGDAVAADADAGDEDDEDDEDEEDEENDADAVEADAPIDVVDAAVAGDAVTYNADSGDVGGAGDAGNAGTGDAVAGDAVSVDEDDEDEEDDEDDADAGDAGAVGDTGDAGDTATGGAATDNAGDPGGPDDPSDAGAGDADDVADADAGTNNAGDASDANDADAVEAGDADNAGDADDAAVADDVDVDDAAASAAAAKKTTKKHKKQKVAASKRAATASPRKSAAAYVPGFHAAPAAAPDKRAAAGRPRDAPRAAVLTPATAALAVRALLGEDAPPMARFGMHAELLYLGVTAMATRGNDWTTCAATTFMKVSSHRSLAIPLDVLVCGRSRHCTPDPRQFFLFDAEFADIAPIIQTRMSDAIAALDRTVRVRTYRDRVFQHHALFAQPIAGAGRVLTNLMKTAQAQLRAPYPAWLTARERDFFLFDTRTLWPHAPLFVDARDTSVDADVLLGWLNLSSGPLRVCVDGAPVGLMNPGDIVWFRPQCNVAAYSPFAQSDAYSTTRVQLFVARLQRNEPLREWDVFERARDDAERAEVARIAEREAAIGTLTAAEAARDATPDAPDAAARVTEAKRAVQEAYARTRRATTTPFYGLRAPVERCAALLAQVNLNDFESFTVETKAACCIAATETPGGREHAEHRAFACVMAGALMCMSAVTTREKGAYLRAFARVQQAAHAAHVMTSDTAQLRDIIGSVMHGLIPHANHMRANALVAYNCVVDVLSGARRTQSARYAAHCHVVGRALREHAHTAAAHESIVNVVREASDMATALLDASVAHQWVYPW